MDYSNSQSHPSLARRRKWVEEKLVFPYGVPVKLRSTDRRGLESLLERLPFDWNRSESEPSTKFEPIKTRLYSLRWASLVAASEEQGEYVLYVGQRVKARSTSLEAVLEYFEDHVQLHVAELSPHWVFVHAGVVEWRGRAIVIPGHSFSGKTTLVAALLRIGATYYSDEYALFDAQGFVHPFARPLSIRQENQVRGVKYAVESLGGRSGEKALPLGLIVISRYRRSALWEPRFDSAGQGVLALFANTVSARRAPQAALNAFQNAVKGAKVVVGERGEADEVAADILRFQIW